MIRNAIISFGIVLLGCTTEQNSPRPYPVVETIGVSNINSDGVTLLGKIDYSSVNILEYGFIVSKNQEPTLTDIIKIQVGKGNKASSFNYRWESGLEKGEKYYVRAFSISNSYTVYGSVISFVSEGSVSPTIISIQPQLGTWGDTITISGRNLSTKIKFDTSTAKILSFTDTVVRVSVPNSFLGPQTAISAQLGNSSVPSPMTFMLMAPVITDFNPKSGTAGDLVTIAGEYWNTSYTKIYLNDTTMKIFYFTKNGNTVGAYTQVPAGLTVGNKQLKIISGNQNVIATTDFAYH